MEEDNIKELDNLFVIYKKDYQQLYKMADAITTSRSYVGGSSNQEYIAAKALQDRLDYAIEIEEERLVFNEDEVQCMAALFDK